MSEPIDRGALEKALTIAAANDKDKNCRTWAKAICVLHDAPAALHRAEPEMRLLTLAEVLELGEDDDSIVYIESRRFGEKGWYQPCAIIFDSSVEGQRNEIHFYEPGNDLPEFWPEAEYGKSWRCWPRKPTPEQMAATKWEE